MRPTICVECHWLPIEFEEPPELVSRQRDASCDMHRRLWPAFRSARQLAPATASELVVTRLLNWQWAGSLDHRMSRSDLQTME
jgi:hypothetical protein